MLRPLTLALCCVLLGCAHAPPTAPGTPMATAVTEATFGTVLAGTWRKPEDVARDRYRHPAQTLAFFGVSPDATVIEITPGGGWYTDLLAPYVAARGHYIGVTPAAAADSAGGKRNAAMREKLKANPGVYGQAELREFDSRDPLFGAEASADVVLTFRNLHNWLAAKTTEEHLRAAYNVLKPGGTLGVVDHRARPGTDIEVSRKTGYVTEQLVIDLAAEVGFELVGRSEVNANPKDDTEHPNGVWTLPPVNRHDAADDAMYKAIGESDRMTLRFRKPG
jgi:predicted methyltransferase